MAGLDRKSLGLAVAHMNSVSIFRTDRSKRFFLVAELKGARQIIRDVAWANGSMRGYDVIATASKDGAIRLYELSTPRSDKAAAGSSSTSTDMTSHSLTAKQASNQPSGIGKGLASSSKLPDATQDDEQSPGRIRQDAKLVDELTNHHGAVWRVAFSQMGMYSAKFFPILDRLIDLIQRRPACVHGRRCLDSYLEESRQWPLGRVCRD